MAKLAPPEPCSRTRSSWRWLIARATRWPDCRWNSNPSLPAPRLVIVTQPSSAARDGEEFASQPVVQTRDPSGGDLAASGVAVTAAVLSGSGTLVGTTVRFTD